MKFIEWLETQKSDKEEVFVKVKKFLPDEKGNGAFNLSFVDWYGNELRSQSVPSPEKVYQEIDSDGEIRFMFYDDIFHIIMELNRKIAQLKQMSYHYQFVLTKN